MLHLACHNHQGGPPIRIERMGPQTSNKKAPYHGPPIVCSRCAGTGFIWNAGFDRSFRCSNSTCPTITFTEIFENVARTDGRQPIPKNFHPHELRPELVEWVAELIEHGVPERT